MRNFLLFLFILLLWTNSFSQTSYTIYDKIVFYDGYAQTVDEPVPNGVTRINNATYTTKLSEAMIGNLDKGELSLEVTIGALCDNYDRLGHVYLAFVEKDATTYTQSEVNRIEIARFITPFMSKNRNPKEVPYQFQLNNISEIFKDTSLLLDYDIWIEFEVFGVPYAANEQVAGCAGRIDVFEGTLVFNVENGIENYTDANFLLPLSCREDLNNYNATDVSGETTKIIEFTLDQPVENAVLYLITSNHGANAGGEEYVRRWHDLYLNDTLIHRYIPGGKSCEPWRKYNTQGNGIYSLTPRTTREWLDFNNWCPGDVIPNREVVLGDLPAGEHTIKLDVPTAVFVGNEGYFPVSMYIQNRKSGQIIYTDPTDFVITEQIKDTVKLEWTENGTATEWEIMYGRRYNLSQESFEDVTDGATNFELKNLTDGWVYEIFVRSVYDEDFTSNWVGPIRTTTILSTDEFEKAQFKVYPNPTKDNIQINSPLNIEKFSIFNQEGKTILEGKSTNNIDLKGFPSGMYIVVVLFENGISETAKIIKH